MSVTIYPARIIPQADGTKLLDNLLPFEAQDQEVLCAEVRNDPQFDGEPFEVNPAFLPGAGFDMSGGNWIALLREIGICDYTQDSWVLEEPNKVAQSCLDFLFAPGFRDPYMVQRAVQLLNVAQVAHARGGVIACG